MSKVMEFQKKLLTDETTRKRFAADPKAFLKEQGVELPAGLKLPASLDAAVVEKQIAAVAAGMKEDRTSVDAVDTNDAHSVTEFIGDTIAVKTKDLAVARAVQNGIESPGGENATVAVVGAVVAAVVAVPVATFGRSDEWVSRINPAGIERITRGQLGMTLHGPNGLRIEGVSVNDAAALIRSLR